MGARAVETTVLQISQQFMWEKKMSENTREMASVASFVRIRQVFFPRNDGMPLSFPPLNRSFWWRCGHRVSRRCLKSGTPWGGLDAVPKSSRRIGAAKTTLRCCISFLDPPPFNRHFIEVHDTCFPDPDGALSFSKGKINENSSFWQFELPPRF